MADEQQLKQLITDGLSAMKTGSETAEKATNAINSAAKNQKLKEALKKGNETSKVWSQRINQALQAAGAGGQKPNPIIDGVVQVNQNILSSAPDDYSRDLGIVAGGQLALHYWVAAFGTMASYTGEAGMIEAQEHMKACVEEAKQADEDHTKLAMEIMGKN